MSVLVILVVAGLVGSSLGRILFAPDDAVLYRIVIWVVTGLLEVHLGLVALSWWGVSWSVLSVAAVTLTAYLGNWLMVRVLRAKPMPSAPFQRMGWGDLLAVVALGAVGYALHLQTDQVSTDFLLTWGSAGRKLSSLGGIDLQQMTVCAPLASTPSWPDLLTELHAISTLVEAGSWHYAEEAWKLALFLGILATTRASLGRGSTAHEARQLILPIAAFSLAAEALSPSGPSARDWLVALTVAAGVPAMLSPPEPRRALHIGILAAVAACSGALGVLAAISLISVYGMRIHRSGRTRKWSASLGLMMPGLLALTTWLLLDSRSWAPELPDLSFELARLPAVLQRLIPQTSLAGLAVFAVVMMLLPIALVWRETRPVGALCAAVSGTFLATGLADPTLTGPLMPGTGPALSLLITAPLLVSLNLMIERQVAHLETSLAWPASSTGAPRIFDSKAAAHPFDQEWIDLMEFRELVWLWTARTVKLRYKGSVLGVVWTLLEPLIIISVLAIVFSSIFRFEIPNYPVYIISGWILWDFFGKSTTAMAGEVQGGWVLSSRVRTPRSAFLVAQVLAHLLNWTVSLIPLVGVMALTGHGFSWALLVLPFSMVLAAVFALRGGPHRRHLDRLLPRFLHHVPGHTHHVALRNASDLPAGHRARQIPAPISSQPADPCPGPGAQAGLSRHSPYRLGMDGRSDRLSCVVRSGVVDIHQQPCSSGAPCLINPRGKE